MTRFRLRELAHARAGDKGDTCNIGVVAYRRDDYPLLLAQVTVERVACHFGELVRGPVTRYELPRLAAINLVLERALGGGVTRSLSLDPHGKSYSALLLTLPVAVPAEVAARLLAAGRLPVPDESPQETPR